MPDPETLSVLRELLHRYVSGAYSYDTLAEHLNAAGFRTRNGTPFTSGSVEHVLSNRFYEGKAVYHPGKPDEEVREGSHDLSTDIRELWLACQQVKRARIKGAVGHPRHPARSYPFSQVFTCTCCGALYHGEAKLRSGGETLKLFHLRRGDGRSCAIRPRALTVAAASTQFTKVVLPYLRLDGSWRDEILKALRNKGEPTGDTAQIERLQRALENLRRQHLWSDLSDQEYRQERQILERQLKLLAPPSTAVQLPNLDRAAQLIDDLPALWGHPGVTDEQREALIKETFVRILVEGRTIVGIEPKSSYTPLFATIIKNPRGGYGRGDWIRTSDLLNPIQVRYQAALRPDRMAHRSTGSEAQTR